MINSEVIPLLLIETGEENELLCIDTISPVKIRMEPQAIGERV